MKNVFKFLVKLFRDEKGSTLSITYSFSPNTLISSSQMNQNFDDVVAVVNALTATNYSADSVGAAALGSDVVRTAYGLIQHTDGSLYVDVSDTNPCLEITDGGLRAKVDDSSIERASGGLQVKALGITNAMLAGLIDLTAKVTGTLPVGNGGTGATAAANAANGVCILDNSALLPVAAVPKVLGAWASKSLDTAYLAATDGFVIATGTGDPTGATNTIGYTDSSNPPTTVRCRLNYQAAATEAMSFTMPVKKGDYWKVTTGSNTTVTIQWIPLGN